MRVSKLKQLWSHENKISTFWVVLDKYLRLLEQENAKSRLENILIIMLIKKLSIPANHTDWVLN